MGELRPVVRQATQVDISACVEAYVAAYQEPPYDGCFDRPMAWAIVQALTARQPETCFVVEVGDKVVGFLFCSTLAGIRATIEEFAVHPEYQRQGLGETLLRHVLDHFRDQGYTSVELVANRNAPVYQFYDRRGFAESSTYTLMSLDL